MGNFQLVRRRCALGPSKAATFSSIAFNLYDGVVRWGVPVFTMISGALFLSPDRKITVKALYVKSILRIVAAFLVWSVFYAVVAYLQNGRLTGAIGQVFTGHYHQWFLFMLVGLYIIVPLLRRITVSREATSYFLAVAFFFSFVIPLALLTLQCADRLLDTPISLHDYAKNIYDKVHFHFAVGYSFYFVLGYYLHTAVIQKKTERAIYLLGILGFAATVILTKAASDYNGSPVEAFYGNFTCNVLLESIAMFIFAKQRMHRIIRTDKARALVKTLAKYSFGVYLVHPFFLETLSRLGWETTSFFPPISIPTIALSVFALSLCTSALLNRIPILNKYIV